MNRSQTELGRAGLVSDGGPPFCGTCGQRLRFTIDRTGRTLESCACGYSAFVQTHRGTLEDHKPRRSKATKPTEP